MYKVIIDNEVLFISNSTTDFIEYCIKHHMVYEVMTQLLPENYTLKLATAVGKEEES